MYIIMRDAYSNDNNEENFFLNVISQNILHNEYINVHAIKKWNLFISILNRNCKDFRKIHYRNEKKMLEICQCACHVEFQRGWTRRFFQSGRIIFLRRSSTSNKIFILVSNDVSLRWGACCHNSPQVKMNSRRYFWCWI